VFYPTWSLRSVQPAWSYRSTDQIFTLQQIFDRLYEYDKDLYACFVDFEQAYVRGSRGKF